MDGVTFFWNGIEPIWRILVVGSLTYFFMIFTLRVSGKRTLANMNAFDFIVTVAIGSAYGRILTARKVALAEAFTTIVLLVVLQFVVSWLEVRSKRFSRLITSDPTLLYHKGRFLRENLRKERIVESKLLAAARKEGFGGLEDVEAIILETDGNLSVIKKSSSGGPSTLKEVQE